MPDTVQIHTLIQSSQQPCEISIIPIYPFSANVDCLLNFSVDVNFHLFAFILPIVKMLAAVY